MASGVRRTNPAAMRKLIAYIEDLPKKIRDRGSPAIQQSAEDYAQALRNAIIQQAYAGSYAPLSSKYFREKDASTGSAPNYWIYNGELLKSIEVRRIELDAKRRSFVAGFPADVTHAGRAGTPMSALGLATTLEFGLGVPARPVVKPTWEANRKQIAETARKSFKRRWQKDKFRG